MVGACTVMTALSMCCMVHLNVCIMIKVCVELCTCCVFRCLSLLAAPGRATQTNAIFLRKWLLTLFPQCCSVSPYFVTLTKLDVSPVRLSPNNERLHFSDEVFVVGLNVECHGQKMLCFDQKYGSSKYSSVSSATF